MLMPPLFTSLTPAIPSARIRTRVQNAKTLLNMCHGKRKEKSTRTARLTPEVRRLSRIPNLATAQHLEPYTLATPFRGEAAWSSPTPLRTPSLCPHSPTPAAPSLGQLAPQQMLHSEVAPKTCVSFKTFLRWLKRAQRALLSLPFFH